MQLTQINPEKRPDLFYAYFDEDLQQWEETEDRSADETEIRLRSACKHKDDKLEPAYQEMVLGSGKMQLLYVDDSNPGGLLVAEGYVQQENETSPDYWETYQFTKFKSEKEEKDKTKSKVNRGELNEEDETASINIEVTWKNKNKKQLYIAKHKTKKIRVRATIKMLMPELCVYDYSDFTTHPVIENPYQVDGVDYVDILFAPDGVMGQLDVDPYLSIDETASTITVACSDDTITFTIATADATLVESNSLRAVVIEDYYQWTIYDTFMLRFRHTTSATTTGMAGNDYSLTNIGTEYDFYPLNSTVNTNSSDYVTALQDSTIADPTKGSWVDDLSHPENYGVDGFAIDGAIHVEPDSNDDIEFDNDIVRYEQPIVVHDFPYNSGDPDTPTDYLDMHDDMSSITDGHSLVVGTGTITVGGTPTIDGDGVYFADSTEYFQQNIPVNMGDLEKGTFIIEWTPGFTGNPTSTSQFFKSNGSGFQSYITTSGQFEWWCGSAGPRATKSGFASAYCIEGAKLRMMYSWDESTGQRLVTVNGTVLDITYNNANFTTWTNDYSLPRYMRYGQCYQSVIHDFKYLDTPIFPYGAHFTGNDGVDATVAHNNVTVYTPLNSLTSATLNSNSLLAGSDMTVSGSPTLATGVDGVSNSAMEFNASGEHVILPTASNFNASKGSISFYFKGNDAIGTVAVAEIFGNNYASNNGFGIIHGSGPDRIYFWLNNGSSRYILWNAGSVIHDNFTNWNHYKFIWDMDVLVDGTNIMALFFNGVLLTPDATVLTTTTGTSAISPGTNFAIGNNIDNTNYYANGIIDEFYITNDPLTPEIPVAGFTPMHIPVIEVA